MSIEPILSYQFASTVLDRFIPLTDYIRVGKLDSEINNDKEWEEIRKLLLKNYPQSNVYIKNCK